MAVVVIIAMVIFLKDSVMPIYNFQCKSCKHKFEKISVFGKIKEVKCPKCGSVECEKLISSFFSKLNCNKFT